MKRTALVAAALAGLLVVPVAAPAPAQDAQARNSIVVMAPRERQTGRTSSGIPIQTVSTQAVVEYDDLDLSTAAGAEALRERVATAARNSCEWLDELYPLANPIGSDDCVEEAVGSAEAQVEAAIQAAAAS